MNCFIVWNCLFQRSLNSNNTVYSLLISQQYYFAMVTHLYRLSIKSPDLHFWSHRNKQIIFRAFFMTNGGKLFCCIRKFHNLHEMWYQCWLGWVGKWNWHISEVTICSYWSPKFHKGRNTIRNNNERGFLSTLFVEELLRKDEKHSYWIVLLLSSTEQAFLCMLRFKIHFCRCDFRAFSVMNWLKSN